MDLRLHSGLRGALHSSSRLTAVTKEQGSSSYTTRFGLADAVATLEGIAEELTPAVKEQLTAKDLARLRKAYANLSELVKFAAGNMKTNIKVDAYDPGEGRFTLRYMTKAKTAKYKNGEIVCHDRWARKRVLLRQELKMRKYGTVGTFWPTRMNKGDIWNEIKAQEQKISDGLQQPGAEEYALELHELIGGYFPLNRVRRSVGFFGVPAGWVPSSEDMMFRASAR